MNRVELRKLSLEFRRISSNFLNSVDDNADVNLSRFLKFINENELIKSFIEQKISGVEYDFKECFGFGVNGWASFNPPEDESCHIKALYDYLMFIHNDNNVNVERQAMRYCWSNRKINVIIQNFIDMAFKPLIDFINDQLSMEMIVLDEEDKTNGSNTFIQNIETVNGSANQQINGTINTYNTFENVEGILNTIDKLFMSLSEIKSICSDDKDDVKDDLEVVQEQLKLQSPKKKRLSKALEGIKRFVKEFSMELGVSLATTAINVTDWNFLIQQVEQFIEKL